MPEGSLDHTHRLIPISYIELVNTLYKGNDGFLKGHIMGSFNHLRFGVFTEELKASILTECVSQDTIDGLEEVITTIYRLTKHLK